MYTSNFRSLIHFFFQNKKKNSYQNTRWRKQQLRNKWLLKWIIQWLWFSSYLKWKQGEKEKLGSQIRWFPATSTISLTLKTDIFCQTFSPFHHPSSKLPRFLSSCTTIPSSYYSFIHQEVAPSIQHYLASEDLKSKIGRNPDKTYLMHVFSQMNLLLAYSTDG